VGGHCVGVDPYYLTAKAEALGYQPEVILAGRRVNDGMGAYVAQRVIKLIAEQGHPVRGARIGILGTTFKENVPDLRNSRAFDIVATLRDEGIEPLVHDPLADAVEAQREYGVTFSDLGALKNLHALILIVPHRVYFENGPLDPAQFLAPDGVLADVKSACNPRDIPASFRYWSL
jgi:UDP-N-acetyl-D-galactosamine dehydrogenase